MLPSGRTGASDAGERYDQVCIGERNVERGLERRPEAGHQARD